MNCCVKSYRVQAEIKMIDRKKELKCNLTKVNANRFRIYICCSFKLYRNCCSKGNIVYQSTNEYAVKGKWGLVFKRQEVRSSEIPIGDHEAQGENYANTCD